MSIYRVQSPSELEEAVNAELGLNVTKGSGSVHGDGDGKGGARGEETYSKVLAECKFTGKQKKVYSFLREDWEKTKRAARRYGRVPLMALAQGGGPDEIMVALSLEQFGELYQKAQEFDRLFKATGRGEV